MISIISSNCNQRDKSQTNSLRNLQTAVNRWLLKIVPKVDNPKLQTFHFQQGGRMLLSALFAGLIEKAEQEFRFKLPQTLNEALQISDTVLEAENSEKKK
jgi:hypothetical protein